MLVLLAAILLLLHIAPPTHSLPSSSNVASSSWILQLNNTVDDAVALAAISAHYSQAASMESSSALAPESATAEPMVLKIGSSFRAVVMPAGSPEMRLGLNSLDAVQEVAEEVEYVLEEIQDNAPVHLDRVDARNGLDQQFHIPQDGGNGVDIYVVDSGINVNHPELRGRATMMDLTGEGNDDRGSGHGSHVAGLAAGSRHGIARSATLHGIKIFAANRTNNVSFLRGLAEVTRQMESRRGRPAVVNLSLSGARGTSGQAAMAERAIQSLVNDGVAVVAAAGNQGSDACERSPGFIPQVVTVGNINPRNDSLSPSTNTGECVTVFAPGVQLTSASNEGEGTKVKSGTSMSTPLVSGMLAVLMGRGMTAEQAIEHVKTTATLDVIPGELRGSPNRVVYLDPGLPLKLGTSRSREGDNGLTETEVQNPVPPPPPHVGQIEVGPNGGGKAAAASAALAGVSPTFALCWMGAVVCALVAV